jgi:hypothetical protein
MSKDSKTPQAFPYSGEGDEMNYSKGMTLRDYFAAKAMQGLLSNPKLQNEILKQGGCHSGWIETSAWAFADEMLKARKA